MAKDRHKLTYEVPLWEWIFAWAGLCLVAATIGFVGYKAVAGDNAPPDVNVRVESILTVGKDYLVTIAASNGGDTTAAQVKIEGELKSGASSVEKSETTFDYVPARSQRKGGLYFTNDPRRHELVITARGYQRP